MKLNYCLLLMALGVSSFACSKEEPKTPVTVDTPSDDTVKDAKIADLPAKQPQRGSIQLGDKLAALCDIPTAYFPFDSTAMNDTAKASFSALAKCFTEGAAKGKGMRIVGHSDPRGETEYNFALGQRRAAVVAAALTERGVSADAIETSSEGEVGATGTDEKSWAEDRKVEIFLDEE